MKFPFLLITLLGFSYSLYSQTTRPPTWSIGWAATYSYAKLENNKSEMQVHTYSKLASKPKASTSWPLNSEKTGIPLAEALLHLGELSLRTDFSLGKVWTLSSGLEIGGRGFDVLEYPLSGRDWEKDFNNPVQSNIAHRNYLVASLPILVKYDLPIQILGIRCVSGLSLNHSISAKQNTVFYETSGADLFFPTLHLGLEIGKSNHTGWALDAAYQQGISTAVKDKSIIYSALRVGPQPEVVTVNSLGSHFRLGVRYAFRYPKRNRSGNKPFHKRGVGQTVHISSNTEVVELCFFDRNEDNDSVSIESKQLGSLAEIGLRSDPQCVKLTVNKDKSSVYLVHAINEGDVKPNTMVARYTDSNGKVHEYRLESSLTKSVKIIIDYEN